VVRTGFCMADMASLLYFLTRSAHDRFLPTFLRYTANEDSGCWTRDFPPKELERVRAALATPAGPGGLQGFRVDQFVVA